MYGWKLWPGSTIQFSIFCKCWRWSIETVSSVHILFIAVIRNFALFFFSLETNRFYTFQHFLSYWFLYFPRWIPFRVFEDLAKTENLCYGMVRMPWKKLVMLWKSGKRRKEKYLSSRSIVDVIFNLTQFVLLSKYWHSGIHNFYLRK